MKVRAIRLAECGRFRAPVALEGLGGGLDIVAGPNELGKSTILKALRFALTERHSSKKAEQLKPYDGGAPTIEVDLEIGAQRWRLRKRYLAQKSVELMRLDGVERLRGEDAEARLTALIDGPDGGGRFPLLWLAQGDALAPLALKDQSRSQIMAALTRDIQDVASGEGVRALQDQIAVRLSALLTQHAVPRPTGRYALALKRAKDAAEALERANQRVLLAATQLVRLEDLRTRETALAEPLRSGALARAVQTARHAVDAAREAAGRAAQAREAMTAAEQRHDAAARDQADHDRAISGLEALGQRIAADATELSGLADRRAAESPAADAARAAAGHAEAAIAALEAEQASSLAHEQRAKLLAERDRLRTARTEAIALAARATELARDAALIIVDDDSLQMAQHEAGAIAVLEARRAAAATRIEIAYVPGAARPIMVDGTPLDHGARLDTTAPLVLDIAGVGRITITPAAAHDHAALEPQLGRHRARLTDLLAAAQAESASAMEAMLRRRRGLESELARISVRAAALAPDGVAVLSAKAEAVEAELASMAMNAMPEAPRSARAVSDALAAARLSLQQARNAASQAAERIAALAAVDAGLKASMEARREQYATLEMQLPALEQRADTRAAFVVARQTAEQHLNEAARIFAGWREKSPDAEGLACHEGRLLAAETSLVQRTSELKRIGEEAARVEGELAGLRNEDAASMAEAFDVDARAATVEVAHVAEDVAALQLISAEIAAEQAATKDRFHGPIVSRLATYVDDVLPGASIGFGTALEPEVLQRAGSLEPIDRLSDGTREQIAVLVRLAFARLLADTGKAVPLILDDALVYSDDARIERMFRALSQAASAHQVLVLTCRTKAFEGLGGNRVVLADWAMT